MNDDEHLLHQTITRSEEISDDVIERLGDERVTSLISAALTEAARRKFPTASPEDIKAFTEDLPHRFPDAEDAIDPADAELLLVAALTGDPEASAEVEEMDPDEVLSLCFLITYAIMSRENLTPDEEKSYIAEVIAEADEYDE
ncbi:hypothetical protein Afil01_23430 [Actinorhabdospora filicis]|uniref:Uncharacterized protein n=1 Tax=Actinorhabdospora filicis TaxID=1785913 RepID=A0A9W6SKR5_9ACTN|nr:hypothetical protein [Actinorhabdospora filicis]GLZ77536.1 hypothetical protein Afil01_23430 [Actinorhabdospora filicis]